MAVFAKNLIHWPQREKINDKKNAWYDFFKSIKSSPFPWGNWSSVEKLWTDSLGRDCVSRSVIIEWGIWSGLQWFNTTTCPPPLTSHTTCTGCNISEKTACLITFEMASFLFIKHLQFIGTIRHSEQQIKCVI